MRLARAILLAAAAVVYGLCVAAPARAAVGKVVATPKYMPDTGPVLAGDQGLLWVMRRSSRVLELWAWTTAAGAKRLQRFVTVYGYALNQPGVFGSAYLSASSTHVGLELFTIYAFPKAEGSILKQTFLGEFGKPVGQVSACRVERIVRSVDVENTTAVFRGPNCEQATVRDLRLGGASDRRFGPGIFAMRLADPFEAWLEPVASPAAGATAVVRDRRTGGDVTRVAVGAVPADVSLRSDGTEALLENRILRFGREDRYEGRVAILHPGATVRRTLPLTVLSPALSRWVGSDLGVVAGDRRASAAGVLRLVDVNGRTTRRIAELGEDRELMRLTDLNATHAAWVTRGCASAEIRVRSLSVPGTAMRRRDRCRLRLARSPKVARGRLRLGISCAGFTHDCRAFVTVRAGRRVIARGSALSRDRAPYYARANLRIKHAARALKHRRVRVRISARIGRFPLRERKQRGEVTRRMTTTIRLR